MLKGYHDQIDKITLTCKLVLNENILDQRKYIERLKLKLAWKEYGRERLLELLQYINDKQLHCFCWECSINFVRDQVEWKYDPRSHEGKPCRVQEYIRKKCQEFNVSWKEDDCSGIDMSMYSDNSSSTQDVHLALGSHGAMGGIRVGKKLWECKSVSEQKNYFRMIHSIERDSYIKDDDDENEEETDEEFDDWFQNIFL